LKTAVPFTTCELETGVNGPPADEPASISALKPPVSVVTVTCESFRDLPASSTTPTPFLFRPPL